MNIYVKFSHLKELGTRFKLFYNGKNYELKNEVVSTLQDLDIQEDKIEYYKNITRQVIEQKQPSYVENQDYSIEVE